MKISKLNPLLAAIVAVSSASASAALIEVQLTGKAINQTTDIQDLPAPNPPDIANSGISYSAPRIQQESPAVGEDGFSEGWPARLTLWIDDETGEVVKFESGLTSSMYFSSQGLQHDRRPAGRTYTPGPSFTCHQFDGADDANGFLGCNGQIGIPNRMQKDADGDDLVHVIADDPTTPNVDESAGGTAIDPNSIILANGRLNANGDPATNRGDGTPQAWAKLSAPGYECGTFDPTASSTNGCARGWGMGQRVGIASAPDVYIPQDARYSDNGSAEAFPTLEWANDQTGVWGNFSPATGVCLNLIPTFSPDPTTADTGTNCDTIPIDVQGNTMYMTSGPINAFGGQAFCLDPEQSYGTIKMGSPVPVAQVSGFDFVGVLNENTGDIDQYPLFDQSASDHPFFVAGETIAPGVPDQGILPAYRGIAGYEDHHTTTAFVGNGTTTPTVDQASCEGDNYYNFILGMGNFNAWNPTNSAPGYAYGRQWGTNYPVMKTQDPVQKSNARIYHETQGQRAGGYFSIEHTGTLAGGDFQVTSVVYQHDTDIIFPTSDGTATAQSHTRFEFDTVEYQGTPVRVPAMGAWGLAGLFAGLVAVAARLRRRVS